MRNARAACLASVCALVGGAFAGPAPLRLEAAEPPAGDGWISLFSGKDLTGWTFRNPKAKKVWVVCSNVRLDPANPARLLPEGTGGGPGAVLLCGDDGRGSDLM